MVLAEDGDDPGEIVLVVGGDDDQQFDRLVEGRQREGVMGFGGSHDLYGRSEPR